MFSDWFYWNWNFYRYYHANSYKEEPKVNIYRSSKAAVLRKFSNIFRAQALSGIPLSWSYFKFAKILI